MINNKEYCQDYTPSELLVITAAGEIKDGEVVFAGVGVPCLASMLAKLTHAPNIVVAMESGSIGALPRRIVLGIGDNACVENALCHTSLWRLFADQQRGFFHVGMISGSQVDEYGNVNSSFIFGKGGYKNPAVCLPGSGGANDIATSAGRTVIIMGLARRRFVQRVDYITSPGYVDGREARRRLNLPGGGPSCIMTDKCVFRFDRESGKAYLDAIYTGISIEEILREVAWELSVPDDVKVVNPPTIEQVNIIRTLDSTGIYTGDGLEGLSFSQYIKMLEESYVQLSHLLANKSSGAP